MATKQLSRIEGVDAYLRQVGARESDACVALRAETAAHPRGGMQAGTDVSALLALLVRATGARRVLEVGTFTGYSALWMAEALPDDGRIVCCDVSEEFTAIARRHWASAGVAHKIDLRLAPATETLERLLAEGHEGSFDLMFVDADKVGYAAYFELGLRLVRRGGLIAFDNTLWGGRVADEAVQDPDTQALRALNLALHADPRVEPALLPLSDGLTLAWRR
jgi:predicted O-methyltransferase YrrM